VTIGTGIISTAITRGLLRRGGFNITHFNRGNSDAFAGAVMQICGEGILEGAHMQGDINLSLIRCVATYNDTWMPITFAGNSSEYIVKRMRQERPVIVLGDGNSIWVSVHRDDVVVALAGAVANPAASGRSHILSGEESLCWTEYLSIITR
jgi:nucleoside-diphosphate-sugar epimerase